MSQKLVHVGVGLNIDNAIGFIHGSGLPGESGGNPDIVFKGSLYVNDADGKLWKKIEDGSGFDKWKELAPGVAPKGLNNFSGLQVIDYYKADDAGVGKWVVEVTLVADKTRKYIAELTAMHNGTPTSDATAVDYNEFGILQLGAAIPGLFIGSSLAGVGTDQVVNLSVSATQNINVIVRRLNFGEGQSNTTALDLTSVPHDVSSSILSSAAANDPILFFAPSRAFRIPANFTNSKAIAEFAGVGSTVFTIYKMLSPNYVNEEVGTLTFSAGSKSGTFSASSELILNSGDVIKISAPSFPDVSLKNICVTLQANYL